MIRPGLQRLEAAHTPIRIGVSGAGWMSSSLVAQVTRMPGMEVAVLADADVGAARQAFLAAGVPRERIHETSALGPAMDTLRAGQRVVTGSYGLAAQLDAVDIVADASSSPANEPGCLCELHGRVTALGYEPIVIGKGKRHVLDRAATPTVLSRCGSAEQRQRFVHRGAVVADGGRDA